MSLYKRGETWWTRFTAPSGERIRRSAGTTDKREAQEYHDQLKVELWRVHRLGEKPRRTWQETAVRWLREREHKATIEQDKAKLRWLDQFFGDKLLDEISRDLIDEVATTKRSEATPATANRHLALIRAILRLARDEWEWIDKVPHVRLFPEQSKRVRWLSPEDVARLLTELPTHLADMAEFTLATGLRQRNVSFLKWESVALERGTAWIEASASKSRKAIVVPLNKDAMRVLHRRLGMHPKFVFTFRDKPVARTSTKAWWNALKRAGIEDFRWHDLRHTWASWHVQSGTSIQELKELGGWASIEMVLRYAHLGGEHLKTAASRIEGTNLAHASLKGKLRLVVSH
jgi:integrase